jgi:glucose-1-phosphate adenylyltransferase
MAPAKHNLLAVILGGGAGSRLFPLTQQRSKPAVPVGGKYRLVDIPISNCINSDILKIFILTQYNSASLNRHIAQTYRFSQFSNGFVEILAAEQTPESPLWFQGTADAVRQVLPHIGGWGIDTLLILSGDHLYSMDYRAFLDRHYETDADVTVSMGIYVFKYARMESLLAEDASWLDFGREVIPAAIRVGKVQAFMFDGYWEDIGTISAFYKANLDLTTKIPKFNLFDADAPVYTRARYLPPSKIEESEIRDSMISDGCIMIGAKVSNSVIGLRSRIAKGVQIDESIVMGADYYQSLEEMRSDALADQPRVGIGEESIIRRAIVDKNARIGSGVRLLNEAGVLNADADDKSYYIREGIIIVPKNAVIRSGTLV